MFDRVAGLVKHFEGSITYYSGWKVEGILLEDQVFMALMKIRQDYPHLHLAQLFKCSTATVSNAVTTMVHVLHKLLFSEMMSIVPSQQKNQRSMPASFQSLAFNRRMIVDCTDIKIAAPSQMDQAKLTYSSYRGMHSFRVLISVAPNGVINFCSPFFPGSVSDNAIMQQSGILEHLVAGDLILADKGFLISDIVPAGVIPDGTAPPSRCVGGENNVIFVMTHERESSGLLANMDRQSQGPQLAPYNCPQTSYYQELTTEDRGLVFVADEAFPLQRHLMRLFSRESLTTAESRVFNYRLSRARLVVENAFGIFSSQWRMYRHVIEVHPEVADICVKATCVLHNYIQSMALNQA
ncbi:hypothetical protein ABVT39_001263 [Epinephelus coioides]